jgi:energy-coupling factor transporter ATP-binding protein EcfA2
MDPSLPDDISQNPILPPVGSSGAVFGNIFEWLGPDPSRHNMYAVVGPPGSGKTTLLKHLSLIFSAGTGPFRLTPLLLFLREHANAISFTPDISLMKLIEESLKDLPPPPGWFAKRLHRGKCLIMLDGLDEIGDPVARRGVVQWIERQAELYGSNRFLVASRPNGYRENPVAGFTVLRVLPFDNAQTKLFVHNWYLANQIAAHQGGRFWCSHGSARRSRGSYIKARALARPSGACGKSPSPYDDCCRASLQKISCLSDVSNYTQRFAMSF